MSSPSPKMQDPSMEEILASIRRIIADDQENYRASPARPGTHGFSVVPREADPFVETAVPHDSYPQPGAGDYDYDDSDAEDGHARHDEEEEETSREADLSPVYQDEVVARDVGPAPEPVVKSEPARHPAARARAQSTLLSEAVSQSISSAFGRLDPAVAMGGGGRTLEDLVQDMLRPLLRDWLDDNLPAIVERLVQAEIERVTRRR